MYRITRGILGIFLCLLIFSSLVTKVSAVNEITSIEDYQIQVSDLKEKIKDVQDKIDVCNANLENAHQLANSARALEILENDEIIQRAKAIWTENNLDLEELEKELKSLNSELKNINKYENYVYTGDFKLTAYCPCIKCCGKSPSSPGYGITAMGTTVSEGRTIAMDGRFPFGTKVYIEGLGERVVEDRGSGVNGNRIDVFVSTHAGCFASKYNTTAKVYIIKD